jgi:hypothetical protein
LIVKWENEELRSVQLVKQEKKAGIHILNYI